MSYKLDSVPTFTATIYVGLDDEAHTGPAILREAAFAAIHHYCDGIGLCVSITDTNFIYTNGGEPGLIVGLINYPRFPSTKDMIRGRAIDLAEILLNTCVQRRISIVLPNETIMLSK